ncbi:MAG: DUF2530 domain-containing protein [Propionibacteriaceae bacterium]|nr:DUF2530 domain-containing protein [Propionibacteriaceae bacterium]
MRAHVSKPPLQQAPVKALDPDGFRVVSALTLAFAVATLVCWLVPDWRQMPFQVCATGIGVGLVLTALSYRGHRKRRNAGKADAPAQKSE